MLKEILLALVRCGAVVTFYALDGHTWKDYLFFSDGKFIVYNSEFTPEEVQVITINEDVITISLKREK